MSRTGAAGCGGRGWWWHISASDSLAKVVSLAGRWAADSEQVDDFSMGGLIRMDEISGRASEAEGPIGWQRRVKRMLPAASQVFNTHIDDI